MLQNKMVAAEKLAVDAAAIEWRASACRSPCATSKQDAEGQKHESAVERILKRLHQDGDDNRASAHAASAADIGSTAASAQLAPVDSVATARAIIKKARQTLSTAQQGSSIYEVNESSKGKGDMKFIDAVVPSDADASPGVALQLLEGPAPKKLKPSASFEVDEPFANYFPDAPQCFDITDTSLAELYEVNFHKFRDAASSPSSAAPSDFGDEPPAKWAKQKHD